MRADEPKDGSADENAKPALAARAAAIQALRERGGFVIPNVEKLRAAGGKDLLDPKHEFIQADFSPDGRNVDEALAKLELFPELQRVYLSGTIVTEAGLARVGRLTNLKEFNLDSTPTDDRGLSRLAGLGELEWLDLSNCKVSGRGMEWLTLLKNLQSLELDGTMVDDDGLGRLASLRKLRSIDLRQTRVTDAGLAHLRRCASLQRISLGGDTIAGAGLAHLNGLGELQRLDLSNTKIVDAGLEHLRPLRKLTTLLLNHTEIGDASADILAGFSELSDLGLGGTAITDAGLAQLAGLRKLWGLDLSGTKITDRGLQSLAGMVELRWLSLENTAVSDAGLMHLKPLASLGKLILNHTKIVDPQLAAFRTLTQLREVAVEGTRVTDADVHKALPLTNPRGVLRTLEDLTELEFVDQPLSDVVEYLRERHDIEIELDYRSLDQAKKTPALPITANLRRVALGKALRQLSADYGLATAVRHDNEVLLIGAKPLSAEPPSLPILPSGGKLSPILTKALGKRTQLEFVDQPLRNVMAYLSARHNIEIVFDNEALTKAGAGADRPVTRNVRGITLKSALELVLGDLDLTCYAEGDRLIVRPIP